MSSSLPRPLYSRSAVTSDIGLLDLSPELILEIASHIVSWDALRSSRRDSGALAKRNENSRLAIEKTNLANLRLVCQYLGEVLQREIFKSLTFNFHVTQSTEVDVEFRLASLARGGTPASRHATFLLIQCLDPIQEGYGWIKGYFSPQSPRYDKKMQSKAESIMQSINTHLEIAVLSLQNLCCIAWDIEQYDDQSILIMGALSSLPLIEDLTLHFGDKCKDLVHLPIHKFRGLLSLAVTLNNYPTILGSSQQNSPVQVVDHFSDIINQSPLLRHLSILQSRSRLRPLDYCDISLLRLTKNIPGSLVLRNLESLRMALPDIAKGNVRVLHHLKALKALNIDGPAYSPTADDHESEPWEALTAAKIELQFITIAYPSNALFDYLTSYSGLKKLHILLTYLPLQASMRCDTRTLFKDILPLHSLSLKVASDLGDMGPSIQEGLVFETRNDNGLHSAIAPSWHFRVCMDSIPSALSFVLESSTQSPECRAERIRISRSTTMHEFPRGDVNMGLNYSQRIISAQRKWIYKLEVAQQDVRRYPRSVILEGKEYHLKCSPDKTSSYCYR